MSQAAPAITRSPAEVVRVTPVSQAPNGICYASAGEVAVNSFDLERMVAAVPTKVAGALERKAYYFVPLTVSQGDETVIADRYDVALSDNAVCHRNLKLGDSQCVFISTRLMDDKFSVAFEFYINVGHALVERAGVSKEFSELAWAQVEAGIRGETSLDAWTRASWPPGAARTPSGIRTNIWTRRFRTRFRFTCYPCIWTWIITICGSGIIRCSRRRRWPSGCGRWLSCFRRIRDLNLRCCISGAGRGTTFFRHGSGRIPIDGTTTGSNSESKSPF